MKNQNNYVIMNEQHTMLAEQEAILKEEFGSYSLYSVPSSGWSSGEMEQVVDELLGNTVVFISPVPYVLARLSFWQGYGEAGSLPEVGLPLKGEGTEVFLFHNSNREKKELPNGKVISVISQTGWELLNLKN